MNIHYHAKTQTRTQIHVITQGVFDVWLIFGGIQIQILMTIDRKTLRTHVQIHTF